MFKQFKELEKREQNAVVLCAIVVFFFLIYQFVLTPYQEKEKQLKNSLSYQSELNGWMQQAKAQFKGVHQNTQSIQQENLLLLINNSIKESSLSGFTFNLSQSSTREIQLQFKEVPFATLISWMEATWSKYQLALKEVELTPLKTQGLVKASLVFGLP